MSIIRKIIVGDLTNDKIINDLQVKTIMVLLAIALFCLFFGGCVIKYDPTGSEILNKSNICEVR